MAVQVITISFSCGRLPLQLHTPLRSLTVAKQGECSLGCLPHGLVCASILFLLGGVNERPDEELAHLAAKRFDAFLGKGLAVRSCTRSDIERRRSSKAHIAVPTRWGTPFLETGAGPKIRSPNWFHYCYYK